MSKDKKISEKELDNVSGAWGSDLILWCPQCQKEVKAKYRFKDDVHQTKEAIYCTECGFIFERFD